MPMEQTVERHGDYGEVEGGLGTLSAAELRFDRWRQTVGLVVGPLVFVLMWYAPFPSLTEEAHRLAAIVSLVVVWWVSEAIPIPVTALVGAALTVVGGVAPASEALGPFADPSFFLFIGSFMIGRAVSDHQLDRRLAFSLLSMTFVQGSLARIGIAIAGLTLVLSAWMSNTATAAMMLPVALGVLTAMGATHAARTRRTSYSFLLTMAYAASIGGIMTPVGTPPNLITIGMLDRLGGVDIAFFTWMLLAVPIALGVGGVLLLVTGRRLRVDDAMPAPDMSAVTAGRSTGPWTPGQRNCAIAFGVAVVLWMAPGVVAVTQSTDAPLYALLTNRTHESIVAIGAACLLFLLPTDWKRRRFTLGWESAG